MQTKIRIIPFEQKYRDQIIDCLKRNFTSLETMSEGTLSEWVNPILSYHWIDDVKQNDYQNKYGYVICDRDNVVGYCGVIISYIVQDSKKYKYANVTTWGIDNAYRIQLFSILNHISKSVDAISDFTPVKSIREINSRMFGFKTVDDIAYKFEYIDSIQCYENYIYLCKNESEIDQKKVRRYYMDHKQYGCECRVLVEKKTGDKIYYLYYRPYKSGKDKKNWVNIIYVSDVHIFTKHIKEIVYEMYQNASRGVICDGQFIDENVLEYKSYTTAKRHRMVWKSNDEIMIPGLCYSEMPLLNL